MIILFAVILFKLTVFAFKVVGTVLGWILGIFGWLFLAGIAVLVFGLAVAVVPAILITGVCALLSAAANG
ncbi:MAG: hypothetical protein ACOYJJ_01975 [Anaerovoracaceae bacterium]